MMSQLRAPRRPIVRDVVPPEIQLVPDALAGQQLRHPPRRVERTGRVLPLALAADEQQGKARAQPLEMVAVQIADVRDGVVEVERVALLTPAAPGRRVVVAGEAERQ